MIRVLVADDHPVVLHGLCTMLEIEPDMAVVGRAADGEAAVAQALSSRPDIILLDVQMPKLDGIEALRRIRAEMPGARVIVLTTYRNEDYIFPSLRAGARGYLLKDASREELADAVRAVARGESLLDPEVAKTVEQAHREKRTLTARELEVLQLMSEQKSNAQIAECLYVSDNTIKSHVSNILAKLECSDRSGAVLTAWKLHLIS